MWDLIVSVPNHCLSFYLRRFVYRFHVTLSRTNCCYLMLSEQLREMILLD